MKRKSGEALLRLATEIDNVKKLKTASANKRSAPADLENAGLKNRMKRQRVETPPPRKAAAEWSFERVWQLATSVVYRLYTDADQETYEVCDQADIPRVHEIYE